MLKFSSAKTNSNYWICVGALKYDSLRHGFLEGP